MRPLTVGVLGDVEWAKDLGKKSTESDIQLASFREGEALVSLVLPIRYPDKPASLAYAIATADALLVVVSAISKELGESVLAADAAQVPQGLIVVRNGIQPEQIQPLVKNTALQGYKILANDKVGDVRAALAEFQAPPREGPVRIPVDHHFDVKGIGAVVLGFVKQGTPKKHDSYRLYPTKKTAQVRSIQVHDEDVDQAQPGDHVGIALKGVTNDDVDRGHVLAPEGSLELRAEKDTIKVQVQCSKFYKAGVNPDAVLYLSLGMQFCPARVKYGQIVPGAAGSIDLFLQKPLVYEKGQRGVLFSLEGAQRVVGSAVVEG